MGGQSGLQLGRYTASPSTKDEHHKVQHGRLVEDHGVDGCDATRTPWAEINSDDLPPSLALPIAKTRPPSIAEIKPDHVFGDMEQVATFVYDRAGTIIRPSALPLQEASAILLNVEAAFVTADEPQRRRSLRPANTVKWATGHETPRRPPGGQVLRVY